MKKCLILYVLLLLTFTAAQAQFDYGNAWYKSNPNRTFIRLVVEEDGIYRATVADLADAGFDLSSVNPDNLKLYYRGKEVPLFVKKSGGQLLYVEFFGEQNNGQIDSIMYRNPTSGLHEPNLQPNKRISLFSDKSAYFLTWDNTPSGNRYFNIFDPTYSLLAPEANFKYTAWKEYKPGVAGHEYVRGGGGPYDSFYTLNSDYVTGEGYVGPGFSYGDPYTDKVPTPFPANTGNPVKVAMRVFGRSNTQHLLKVEMNGNTTTPVLDTAINTSIIYVKTFEKDYTPAGQLTSLTDLTYHANRANTDNNNICYSAITYDRLPNMNGDSTLRITGWNKTTKSYFRLENLVGQDTVYAYDLANRIRHKGLITNGAGGKTANIILLGFPGSRDIFIATDAAIRKPQIESARFNKLFDPAAGAEYVIIAHRSLSASALVYANYRDTATVNPVSVRVVYTDEIYDEYSYGTITPWAVKRFCKDALDHWTIKPRYFFLWGKGKFITRGYEDDPLVPTYGYPATDYEFVSHFDQHAVTIAPEAAIGRLNIFTDAEGLKYLEKVNEYEHSPWQPWMKEGTFLGGGGTLGEQNSIGSAFDYMIDIFSEIPYGGKAHYFQKNSSSITIDPTTASYHDEISAGVSLIHFFGHSTQNIQDVSVREPFEYNNFGKYPLMIAMGCFGGDFTVDEASFGERWVKEPNRGSIGYLGNSSAGYLNPLRDYGRIFYEYLSRNMMGQAIGDVIRTSFTVYTDSLIGVQYRNHGRQMNLQGDPAVKMYHPEKPDLEINSTSIYFTPDNFTAQDDSFRINIITSNYGLATDDSFRVSVVQKLPDGKNFQHPVHDYELIRYRDTLSFTLNNPAGNQMTGQNVFEVFVDSRDSINEYFENNNQVDINRLVPGNIPAILYPVEYAVVGQSQISLQASAFFMTQDQSVGYVFEIDTTAEFNSPAKVNSGVVTGKSTFVEWQLPFTLTDSTVYFWRVRLTNVTPITWGNASFKYIQNRTGWAQSKLEQFTKDETEDIVLDPIQEEWRFANFGVEYEFVTRKNGGFAYSRNGNLVADAVLNGFSGNGVVFVVLDQLSLKPIFSNQYHGSFGSAIAPTELHLLRNAILNTKQGDYFIVGSSYNPHIPQWSDDIFLALKEIGASDNIRLLKEGDAFMIMGRKGYLNSATEIFQPNSGDKYLINNVFLANYQQGDVLSTRIGPAKNWQEIFWNWYSTDPLVQEKVDISVYGERFDGTDSLFFEKISAKTLDITNINADEFHFLRLTAHLQDTAFATAPQLDNWHVLFVPSPDAVVDPVTNFEFRSDTVVEGQDVFIHMGAKNISPFDMDSVKVKIFADRNDRTRLLLDSMRIAPLLANGPTVEFEYQFNTFGLELEGNVNLIVEINPDGDQPEQHLFNNIYVQAFYVVVDRINPILDVTVDGKHVIDGDIISPRPEILIEVNDENRFQAVTDSAAFELYFKKGITPSTDFERIFITTDARIDWQPGQLPENKARLYFYPGKDTPLEDGDYTLKVQGKDQRGNASGKGESFYEIRFKVESKSTLTQVLNYPNPFSSSTRFVYTLTGMEIPDLFQIHIYTISGKLVKVIDLLEMGDVSIGRNITNYAWDGTDEYGDRLANGVYLYRVVTRMPTQTLELQDQSTQQYFNNGFGKMVIMR
ncbi:MAG: C25 family cysteine peptidase [Bacteroidia bacterium]|nr:C25 family cysteine peptidase [Bacteroidia bacterium]